MSTTSPVQHALSIRELLFRIFLYSTNQSNAVNARVCKLWSNEALSINWYSIEADVLLNLLEPLEETSSLWPFGISSTEAWARFDEYAWRVRVLSFPPDVDYPYTIFDQVLNIKFERNRPLVHNLTAVSIDIEPDLVHRIINLFGHTSVRKLTLGPYIFDDFWGCSEPLETALKIFKSALINMPSIRTFRVSGYDESEESSTVVQAFASIVGGIDKLEEVQIPAFWLTDPVVDALAALPVLRSLEIHTADTPSPAQFTTIPAIGEDYFPSLEALSIDIDCTQAVKWFAHPRFPKTLTALFFYLPELEGSATTDAWTHLLTVIGSQLRHLRTLRHEHQYHVFRLPGAPHSFDTLRPLLSLSDLRDVSLETGHDMTIAPNELVALFNALPRLKHLYIPHTAPVDIACLADIAPVAQQLHTLTLSWRTPASPAALPRAHRPFAHLTRIDGALRCGLPAIAVAEFLEDVLPPGCSVPGTWGVAGEGPETRGLVCDIRAAFGRVREKDRRRRARAWAYVGPVGRESRG
ncbi:hypothetical protein PC9H_005773 [Pleurotus ostreatus]|uniref:F-box domain-containing protein n=1 Tax=Pleurotus ostreatus TaxID=5322 RepID=A0A8H7DUP7_PLEOS|nr:uncharacterized protein PC9H_005773 [Pleurotus ostreatus]KAF7433807.1 hypothetical protein PC9H_005773 [Pleurotus ostreatus]KAJ8697396.1 hypothetical protein PTI98_004206 [Pleurotus ostreatus]